MASNRCIRCGKWFMSKPQLIHHQRQAERLCNQIYGLGRS